MQLEVLTEIPEQSLLREQWNALALRVDQPQIFYTYEWALAVYRAYHATLRPLLFLARNEDGALSGVAALASDPQGKRASFLCATTGDYCDFLSLAQQRPEFVTAVLNRLRSLRVRGVTLTNLPADSVTIAAIRQGARQNGFFCHARTAYMCAQVQLDLLERRGQQNPVLPRKKMLRRFLNAMGREHPVRLDHARSWDSIGPILPEFMQAHAARFLVTGRISNMARPERQNFLAELAQLLSESGWVALTRMMSGDRVFAWNYGFQFAGTWFWYQPTFDSDLEKYSPGFCSLAKVIEEASESPEFRMVDLGLGAEEYKERFANRNRETLYVTLRTSVVEHCREVFRDAGAGVVKSSPRIERTARSLIGSLQNARKEVAKQGAAGALRSIARALRNLLWTDAEICFYEWSSSTALRRGDVQICSMDLRHLAAAAMKFVEDNETLSYLLRATRRLRSRQYEGFVLLNRERTPVHFAWLAPFDGFFVPELNAKVKSSSSRDVLYFDCWTPLALRDQGYSAGALDLISAELRRGDKQAWGYSLVGENAAWHMALQKAGFEKRYSLRKSQFFWRSTITRHSLAEARVPGEEASVRV